MEKMRQKNEERGNMEILITKKTKMSRTRSNGDFLLSLNLLLNFFFMSTVALFSVSLPLARCVWWYQAVTDFDEYKVYIES